MDTPMPTPYQIYANKIQSDTVELTRLFGNRQIAQKLDSPTNDRRRDNCKLAASIEVRMAIMGAMER